MGLGKDILQIEFKGKAKFQQDLSVRKILFYPSHI